MPSFAYHCVSEEGVQRDGVVVAASLPLARQQLEGRGWRVLTLSPLSSPSATSSERPAVTEGAMREVLVDADALVARSLPSERDTLSTRVVAMFLSHLGLLIASGFSFSRSLALLAESDDLDASRLAGSLLLQLESGTSLSLAMSRHPAVFSPSAILLVNIGERTGRVPQILEMLSIAMRRQEERRGRFVGVLVYPACVLTTTAAMMLFLVYYMLPRYVHLFTSTGNKLPALTASLLILSANPMPIAFVGGVVAGFVAVFSAAPRSPLCNRIVERVKFRGPARGLFHASLLATLCQNLALLTGSGVTLLDAMKAVCDGGTGWSEADQALREALTRVRSGLTLSAALALWPVFPQMLVGAVTAGETSGRLPEMLTLVGGIIEEQVEHRVEQLGRALEPLMLLIMGVGVAFVVLAAFLPVFQLARAF